jgi:2-polyprenyl-6-methoxyphenol hydroxylase-like FAD-dependent oxidoreductase
MNDKVEGFDAEVVIVGGGPVGMGLAIELGQRNIRCVVVERYSQPQPVPKGQNLTQRTMEHFHFWGAEKELRAARTIPKEYGIGGLTAYGKLLGPHYDWLQRDLVKPYYFTGNERLPQYATEAVMRQRVAQLPSIQTLYGWGAEGVQQDANGVTLTVAERGSAQTRQIRAAYVVGCDGSRSLVRESVGLTQSNTDHDRMMVLLVFKSEGLHELLKCYPGKSYYNVLQPELKGYWKFFGRVDLGSTWFFHAPVPQGTTKDNFDFSGYLQEAVGAPFEIEFQYIGFWDLRFMLADHYREGRVFISGDAAHSHPPYGGYGVNSGLEDARNLGWKLAAKLQGWGGEGLLDSYDAERRPVFGSTIRDFIAKGIEDDRRFLETQNPLTDKAKFDKAWSLRAKGAVGEVHSFEPNYEGSPVVASAEPSGAAPSSVGSHRFTARVGHHLAPAVLADGQNVYERFGTGFTLLAFGETSSAVHAFVEAAAELGIPLTVVTDPAQGEAARYEVPLILVRPDNFVAWIGGDQTLDETQARGVLNTVIGR